MKNYKLTYYKQVAPGSWIKDNLTVSLPDKNLAQAYLNKKFPFNKTRLTNVEKVVLRPTSKKEAYYSGKENKRNKGLKKAEDYKAKRDKKHAKQLAYDKKKNEVLSKAA